MLTPMNQRRLEKVSANRLRSPGRTRKFSSSWKQISWIKISEKYPLVLITFRFIAKKSVWRKHLRNCHVLDYFPLLFQFRLIEIDDFYLISLTVVFVFLLPAERRPKWFHFLFDSEASVWEIAVSLPRQTAVRIASHVSPETRNRYYQEI